MWFSKALAGLLLFVGTAMAGPAAQAQSNTLPDPIVETCIYSNCVSPSYGTVSGPGGTATTSVSPSPSVSAQGNATAGVTYFFSVNGPANTLVPVDVSLALSASGTSVDDNGLAALFIYTGYAVNNSFTYNGQTIANASGNEVNTVACSPFNSNDCYSSGGGTTYYNVGSASTGVETFKVLSNNANEVQLLVVAQHGGSATGDPIISIDPSFADASQFTVSLSPGVGNVSPVPEPATAWLMLSGLGGLFAMSRKRRKAA